MDNCRYLAKSGPENSPGRIADTIWIPQVFQLLAAAEGEQLYANSHLNWGEAVRRIERGIERTTASRRVTYDLARLMDGAEEVLCFRFADLVCDNTSGE